MSTHVPIPHDDTATHHYTHMPVFIPYIQSQAIISAVKPLTSSNDFLASPSQSSTNLKLKDIQAIKLFSLISFAIQWCKTYHGYL